MDADRLALELTGRAREALSKQDFTRAYGFAMEAWSKGRSGVGLVEAGLAQLGLHDEPAAQPLFDRGIARLESILTDRLSVELDGPILEGGISWTSGGDGLWDGRLLYDLAASRVVLDFRRVLGKRTAYPIAGIPSSPPNRSPDGTRYVIGGAMYASTGRRISELPKLAAYGFSYDSRLLVGISEGQPGAPIEEALVLDTATGKPTSLLKLSKNGAGTKIVSCASDAPWCVLSGGNVQLVHLEKGTLYSISDGEWAAALPKWQAVVNDLGRLRVLDVRTGRVTARLGEMKTSYNFQDVVSEATGGKSKRVYSGYCPGNYMRCVEGLVPSRNGRWLSMWTPWGGKLLDTAKGIEVAEWDETAEKRWLAVSPDGESILDFAARGETTFRISTRASRKLVRELKFSSSLRAGALPSPSGRTLLSSTRDRLNLYDLTEEGQHRSARVPVAGSVASAAWLSENVIAITHSGGLVIWDINAGRAVHSVAKSGNDELGEVQVTPAHLVISMRARPLEVHFFDRITYQEVGHCKAIDEVSPSGRIAMHCRESGGTGRCAILSVPNCTELTSIQVQGVGGDRAFSSDDRLMLVGNTVWEWKNKNLVSRLQKPGLPAGEREVKRVFDANGSHVITLTDDFGLVLWETATGKLLQWLPRGQDAGGSGSWARPEWTALPLLGVTNAITRVNPRDGSVLLRISGGGQSDLGSVSTADGFVDLLDKEPDQPPLCRVGPHLFPWDVCRDRFSVPGLLHKVLSRDESFRRQR